ncbi:MAG: mechanosensitive ion channel [Deltaproteobacteria bacterium]|nr:MAG: mechanosensitive ion channel [Deltaproteobacteria bacterium]
MEQEILKLGRFQEVVQLYGFDLLLSLAMLVAGLILAKLIHKYCKIILRRFISKESTVATVANIISLLIIVYVVSVSLHHVGMDTIVIRRIIIALTLAVIAVIIVFRPLIPSLPFKVGQVVKAGNLLGKVESTSLINTRLRTFDGKTFFVPNQKIINDIVQNYHLTGTRRIKLNVGIRYDQDLMKAKQVLEAIMVEDPRVNVNPRPVVWVLNLTNGCVELGGRCWVDNVKYWKTRCELLEKTKLRFDAEGIVIAHPQRDVHIYYENLPKDRFGEANSILEQNANDPEMAS